MLVELAGKVAGAAVRESVLPPIRQLRSTVTFPWLSVQLSGGLLQLNI